MTTCYINKNVKNRHDEFSASGIFAAENVLNNKLSDIISSCTTNLADYSNTNIRTRLFLFLFRLESISNVCSHSKVGQH